MGPGRTSTVHGCLVRQEGCGWPDTTTTTNKSTALSNIVRFFSFFFLVFSLFFSKLFFLFFFFFFFSLFGTPRTRERKRAWPTAGGRSVAETGAGKHVPRAVFVKREFTVVDEVHSIQDLCTQQRDVRKEWSHFRGGRT